MENLMLPHDVRSAFATLKHLRTQVGEHQEARAQYFFAIALLFLGSVLTWALMPVVPDLAKEGVGSSLLAVAAGALAYAAILIGFVVNLMLFSGKIESPQGYSPEELNLIIPRLRYILYSQMVTLFAAIGLSAMTLLGSLVIAAGVDRIALGPVLFLSGGFAFLCVVRTALLPLQIYELHETSFSSMAALSKKIAKAKHANRSHEED
ncbi:hypothetical protein [Xanthomonas campestris]|uniref:hypothetical protein n=1 Tax=Xanthomonas campestris TaxID=339 RepID=UPI0020C9DF2F|nr:hypothetical protein [Xanthomonas campestris]